jgi:FG-GAP-like repeat
MTRLRQLTHIIVFVVGALTLCGCGGGSSGSGTGKGGNTPSIATVSPTSMMVNVPLGTLLISGSNFTADALVQIDGQPISTDVLDSHNLQANLTPSYDYVVATHQITVQESTGTSNAVSMSVYAPQQGPFVMNAVPGFLVGTESNPPWIAVADLDGDGFADVLMPNDVPNGSGGIAILKGRSDGSLASPVVLSMQTPYALLVGDVDGDGIADLVSVTQSGLNSAVTVLHGDGHGNFQQTTSSQVPYLGDPVTEYLSDLDGDGKLDLVLAGENGSATASNIEWLRNTGGGNFSPATTLATMNASTYFAIGDLNGDGKPDIVYSTQDAPFAPFVVHTLLNQGSGQFSDNPTPGLNGIGGLATILDFNLDGIPDLVVQAVQNNLTIQLYSFAGKGDGSFQQVSSVTISPPGYHIYTFVVGDFDHDGFPDLAGPDGETEPSHILYLFGDGRGNFTPQKVVGPQGGPAALGDINGDGIPDVVVPDRFSFVSVALGRTDRKFPSAFSLTPQLATTAYAGDVNGDGLLDIFVGGFGGNSVYGTVFQNQGNDSFQFGAFTDPTSFMVADLTGKGTVDLIGSSDSGLVIWPNNGTFGFSSSPITLPPLSGTIMVVDMDGDGHPDIVGDGQIFYGKGDYQFTPVATPSVFSGPYLIGDFNGDGKLDIAIGGATWVNAGNRTFNVVTTEVLPLVNGSIAVVADFNRDGRDDVAIDVPDGQSVGIYYGQSDGTFVLATELDAGEIVGGLAVGDFDGDGHIDVAAGLMLAQQGVILFNQGNGEYKRSYFASGADTVSLTGADLNHTGNTDLIFTNFELDYRPPNVDVVFQK